MIQFSWYHFGALTAENLYRMLALRSEVFVTEQQSAYTDPDGRDFAALHLLCMNDQKLAACLRLFPPASRNDAVVFGRVVTAKPFRKQGIGRQLIQEMLRYCEKYFPQHPIECSAQNYLRKFYEEHDFMAFGDVYIQDGIPHIAMRRTTQTEK